MLNGMNSTTEVKARATRRRFSAKEKLEVLALAEACTASGELSALMRSRGLYSSHLSTWRVQRDAGQLGPNAKKRGPIAKVVDPRDAKIAKLERLLRRSELVCEIQKKVATLCGWELATLDDCLLDESSIK